MELICEARDAGLYRAITDCGAGGSVLRRRRDGADPRRGRRPARVPLKYPGLRPWEVWLSEAQERMVLAVPAEHARRPAGAGRRWGCEVQRPRRASPATGACVVHHGAVTRRRPADGLRPRRLPRRAARRHLAARPPPPPTTGRLGAAPAPTRRPARPAGRADVASKGGHRAHLRPRGAGRHAWCAPGAAPRPTARPTAPCSSRSSAGRRPGPCPGTGHQPPLRPARPVPHGAGRRRRGGPQRWSRPAPIPIASPCSTTSAGATPPWRTVSARWCGPARAATTRPWPPCPVRVGQGQPVQRVRRAPIPGTLLITGWASSRTAHRVATPTSGRRRPLFLVGETARRAGRLPALPRTSGSAGRRGARPARRRPWPATGPLHRAIRQAWCAAPTIPARGGWPWRWRSWRSPGGWGRGSPSRRCQRRAPPRQFCSARSSGAGGAGAPPRTPPAPRPRTVRASRYLRLGEVVAAPVSPSPAGTSPLIDLALAALSPPGHPTRRRRRRPGKSMTATPIGLILHAPGTNRDGEAAGRRRARRRRGRDRPVATARRSIRLRQRRRSCCRAASPTATRSAPAAAGRWRSERWRPRRLRRVRWPPGGACSASATASRRSSGPGCCPASGDEPGAASPARSP